MILINPIIIKSATIYFIWKQYLLQAGVARSNYFCSKISAVQTPPGNKCDVNNSVMLDA